MACLPALPASPASSPTTAPVLLLRDTFPFTQALWDGFVAMAMNQSGEGEGERENILLCVVSVGTTAECRGGVLI